VDKPIPNDPVAGLIDIPLPAAISLWPTTWTSRVAIVLIVVGLIAAIWRFARRWHANRYRRAALAELDRIMQAPQPSAGALELLLRRTALAVFPRDVVAPLTGPAWLAFLDSTYRGHEFSQGTGSMLALSPYAPQTGAGTVAPLADLVRRWIRTHHA
jgi:Ca-activated chloride channel family protein